MHFFYSFLLLLSTTTAFSQNQRCFSYDAAGNRVNRVSGTCSAPSGLVATPGGLTGQENAQALEYAKTASAAPGSLANPEVEGVSGAAVVHGVVYPNPTSGMFTITLDGPQEIEGLVLELFDARGRLVERQIAPALSASFDLSAESPGHYFLFAKQTGQAPKSWKVVKQ